MIGEWEITVKAACVRAVPETVRRKTVVTAKRESVRSVIRRISGASYFKTWTGWGTAAMIRNSFLRTVRISRLALGIARCKNHFSLHGTAPAVPGTARSAISPHPSETQSHPELDLPFWQRRGKA